MVVKSGNDVKKVDRSEKCKLLTSLLLGVSTFTILVCLFLSDPILHGVRYYSRVTNGSMVHQLMYRDMENIHLSVYLFNITNAEEFLAGDQRNLKVQEVGPFTYKQGVETFPKSTRPPIHIIYAKDMHYTTANMFSFTGNTLEIRSHEDILIDSENQLLHVTPKLRTVFQIDESVGYPEDVNVTMLNLAMLGTASMLSESFLMRMGFNAIINQLSSPPVIKTDVHTFLWGYHEPLVALAHTLAPGYINFEKMGILDRIYDKNAQNKLVAHLDEDRKFMLVSRNGYKKLKMSDSVNPEECEKCSSFENSYEGLGYPIGITPEFPIRIFRNGLCRILDLEFFETRSMDYGGEALVYHFSDSFYSFTNETSDGLLDLSDCFYGMPFSFSKAHFLDMDPSIYERIEGMKPDDRFRGWILIEPRLGMQLETVFSIQMNLVLGDLSYNTKTSPFSNMVIPICYLKIIQPELPEETKDTFRLFFVVVPYTLAAIKTVLFILTILFWGYAARMFYINRKREETKLGLSFPITVVKNPSNGKVEEPLMEVAQEKNGIGNNNQNLELFPMIDDETRINQEDDSKDISKRYQQ